MVNTMAESLSVVLDPFSGAMGAAVGAIIMFLVIFFLAYYIFSSLAMMAIAKKIGTKNPWLAWIPIANLAMILQLGGFNWAWIFLLLIPLAGWLAVLILLVIATWRIFEKRGYPGWLSLSMIIPKVGFILYLIVLGFVAWQEKQKAKVKKR